MKYLPFFLILAACASTPFLTRLEHVQVGMEKDEVLEIMGTPKVHRRVKGRDVYTYKVYENNAPLLREIQFEQGQVVYVGDITVPEESAEEADERIRRENEALSEAEKKARDAERERQLKVEKEIETKRKRPVFKEI